MGDVIAADGIAADPKKIEAISFWPQPSSPVELKSFLGLCSYYRRFIASFADVVRPLQELLGRRPFEWTTEAEGVFQQLKQMLTRAPILGYPLPDIPFVLDTDASNDAIGAVLSQYHEGQEKVIAYYSKALSSPERKYCVTRRELLAVVKAVQHFQPYLYGQHFTV